MRRLLTLILLLVALPAGAGLFDSRPGASLGGGLDGGGFLKVDQAFKPSVERSDAQHVLLRFVNAEGYYLYRHRFQFKVEPAQVSLGQVQLPAGKQHHDEYFGDTEVYYNIVDLEIPLNNPARQPYTLVVTYQGCADKGLCYPPETRRFDIDGGAAPPAASDAAGKGPLEHKGKRSLLFFFLAGLTLTFTPCVLPMLPILSGVVLRGRPGGGRGFVLSLAYVLPMALCFALLGALMGMFGASLNLQAQLQSPWVLVPFAAFFALFAVAMFGFFELRLPGFIREPLDRLAGDARGGSILGAATLGVLSSLLVSPCVSAPLAASLLYISASGDAWGGRPATVRPRPGHGYAAGGVRRRRRRPAAQERSLDERRAQRLRRAVAGGRRVAAGAGGVRPGGADALGHARRRRRPGPGRPRIHPEERRTPPAATAWPDVPDLRGGRLDRRPAGRVGPDPSAGPLGAVDPCRAAEHARRMAEPDHPGAVGRRPGRGTSGRQAGAAGLVCGLVHQLQGHRAPGSHRSHGAGTTAGLPPAALRHHRKQPGPARPAGPLQPVRSAGDPVLRPGR
ncbi:hypothetical protein HMPREF3150_05348 [Pseudomonas aeruginosa]|nr:hypothetical protein HMPREF3150_05348 [Pseudomonas aeruginosa]